MSISFRFIVVFLFTLSAESLYAQNLSSIINNAPNKEAFWSVTIRDENGNIIESINPEKTIIPASNQKLMTSGAILDHFGSDYRFETIIYGDGELHGTTW